MATNSLLELDGSKFRAEKSTIKLVNVPKSIDDFLSKTNTSMVLVGQKGTGKSILLSLKKYNDIERIEETKTFIFPKSSGVEEINFDGEFGVRPLSLFGIEDWEKIFTISIQYYLFCQLRDPILDNKHLKIIAFDNLEIHKYLNPESLDVTLLQFGNVLDSAIKNKICYKDLRGFVSLARTILIGGIIEKDKNNIFFFLDGLDQAIYKAIHRSEKSELTEDSELKVFFDFENSFDDENLENNTQETNKVGLWIKAQLGFLKALHFLNELNRNNFKIFGSIRYEAYIMMNHYNLRNLPQLKSTCKIITYSNDELIEIFEKLLFAAEIKIADLKKFGITELIHNKVKNNTYNRETVQEHVLRHTLRNPREITYQILAIKNLFNTNMLIVGDPVRNTLSLKEHLSSTIKEIKKDLETETLPAFPSKSLEKLLREFKKNYIPKGKVIDEHREIITVLYRLGLIGVLKKIDGENSYKQYFLEKNIYFDNANIILPDSPFYLLHPVLDPLLFDNYGHDKFYYPHCIIGHGLPFIFVKGVEHYLPVNFLKPELSGDLQKAKKIFTTFWHDESALEKYTKILDSFYSEWACKILSFYLLNDEDFTAIKNKFFHKLGGSNFLTIDITAKISNDVLRRNYKLRMIVALALACKLFDKKMIEELYTQHYKFKEKSFFSNIRNQNLVLDKVLGFLSKFELDCLHEVLNLFDKNNSPKLDSTEGARDKFSKLSSIFPSYT